MTDRREVLAGLAGCGALALTGTALRHRGGASPDAALLDLGRRHGEAAARRDAATHALDAAQARYVPPPSPEALFYRPGDGLAYRAGAVHRDGRLWLGRDVDSIRAFPCGYTAEMGDGTTEWCPNRRDEARRDEVVAAHEAWQAETAVTRAACGLPAAEAEDRASFDALLGVMRAMTAAPATTLAGVLAKARAVGWAYGGVQGLADEIGGEPDGTAESMALAVVRDLLTIAEAGRAARV